MPKFSVVMPYYNRPSTINNAIHSILDQTITNWELIVVDDGSDDQEGELLTKSFKDDRIKYYRISHQGLVAARNFGNDKANGEWIVVQDSDDLSMPDRLEKLKWVIDSCKDEECDVIYHALYCNVWSAQRECITRLYIPAFDFDRKRLLKEQYIPGVACYKRDVWRLKPFRIETQYAYDWMMYLDWAYSGFNFIDLDLGLYEYVRQEDSVSSQFEKTGQRAESLQKIKQIMLEEYHQNFTGDQLSKWK